MKIFLIINFIFFNLCYARNSSITDEILDKINFTESKISDLKMEFKQEITIKSINEKQIVEGRIFYKKPDKILFIQTSPQTQTISVNKNSMLIYNPSTNNVLKGNVKDFKQMETFLPGIFNPCKNFVNLRKYYTVELSSQTNTEYELLFKPKSKKYNFKLYLLIDKTNFLPIKNKFESDILTSITDVNRIEINTNLTDTLFDFKVPKDAEIMNLK